MHVEIQVALNFFISFLYNKLPRRRVNQFGEELEKALKIKFQGHWYPEKALKGSGFRCLKTTVPLDPVFEIAAQESGTALADIQDNLPEELSIWIDPGEVSYKIGEKGIVKILYREFMDSSPDEDREIYRTFNPEAQCFKPIDSVASQLASLSLSQHSSSNSSSPFGNSSPSPPYTPSPSSGFIQKQMMPVTFTTATFAQTKFGSTKLKNCGKRSQRMSPTEFSSYIKQRSLMQQQQHQQSSIFQQQTHQRPRSLSPSPLPLANMQFSPFSPRYDGYDQNNVKSSGPPQLSLFFDKGPFGQATSTSPVVGSPSTAYKGAAIGEGRGFIDNYNVNGMSYANQHLLMAN